MYVLFLYLFLTRALYVHLHQASQNTQLALFSDYTHNSKLNMIITILDEETKALNDKGTFFSRSHNWRIVDSGQSLPNGSKNFSLATGSPRRLIRSADSQDAFQDLIKHNFQRHGLGICTLSNYSTDLENKFTFNSPLILEPRAFTAGSHLVYGTLIK